MWQRFTAQARRAVFYAQEEAARRGERRVEPRHLLLALLRENECGAARLLDRMAISPAVLRAELERELPSRDGDPALDMQLTPAGRRAIELAYEEAQRAGSETIGTGHLLLGALRQEEEGPAPRRLQALGVELDRARALLAALDREERSPAGGPLEAAGLALAGTFRPAGRQESTTPDQSAEMLKGLVAEPGLPPLGAALEGAVSLARSACAGLGDLTGIRGLTTAQAWALLALGRILKRELAGFREVQRRLLPGRKLALVFEKPSLRTRVSFESGIADLGGLAIYLGPSDIRMGVREPPADVARNLERMVDGIAARVFAHSTVRELAAAARIPVVNALCDLEHPCQAFSDLLTIWEHRGSIEGQRIAYVGDGNNVAHSLMLLGGRLGARITVATPEGYGPDPEITAAARRAAEQAGGSVEVLRDPREACSGADVVYTDVWASMGQEEEAEARARVFAPYQVNESLVALARPDYLFMHCLPAHRGEEVSAGVADGPNSVIFDQAENRLHAQKAILAVLLGGESS